MSKRNFKVLVVATGLIMMVGFVTGCKSLDLKDKKEDGKEMPGARTGFLPAKVVAFRHAVGNMPEEDKRYGSERYAAMAISDRDPSHVKVLMATLAGADPPIIDMSDVYSRAGNSKWLNGKPIVVWSSKITQVTEDVHVFIVLGWMHSDQVYQFYEYKVRWIERSDSWEVADFKLLERSGS